MANCRSCGAEITWAKTSKGRDMPLQEDASGEYVIVPPRNVSDPSRAVRITDPEFKVQIEEQLRQGRRFISHFAACPEADTWRKDS